MLFKKSLISLSIAVAVGAFGLSSVGASESTGKRVWDSLRSDGVSTHTTRARSFESRYGRHWTGGQASIRIRQSRPRNVVNLSPPRLDSGCSGIDFYAGSFSLLSGDEIVQMYRGAMQGAASYFFGLAVQSLCPSCYSIAEGIKDDIQKFNDMLRMDCQRIIDSEFGQSASEGIIESATNVRSRVSRALGFSDGNNNILGESQTPSNTPPDILRMTNANVVVDLVKQLNSTNKGSFSSYMTLMGNKTNANTLLDGVISDESLQGAAIMLMSLMGTYYIRAVEDQAECDAMMNAGQECMKTNEVAPTLTFSDLAFGRADGYSLNGCKPGIPDCTESQRYEFEESLEGFFDFIKDLVAGSGSDKGIVEHLHATATRSDISNAPNGDDMIFLMDNVSYPWLNLAMATRRGNGYSIDTVAELVALNITEYFITELHRELQKVLSMRRTDPTGVDLTGEFRRLYMGLEQSFMQFKDTVNTRYENMQTSFTINAQLRDILRGE